MAFSGSLNFISASDIGSARYAGGNRQYAWTQADADTHAAVNQFIPVDFVGLNTIIREEMHFSPTGEGSANILSASLFYSGLFGSIVGSFKTGSVLNFNESWPANGAFKRATGAEGIKASQATVLNSVLLNRQGPYQHPSWKQIRGGEHSVARKLRRFNTASIEVRYPDPEEKHLYFKSLWQNREEYEEKMGAPWGSYSHVTFQGTNKDLPGFLGDKIRPKIEYYYEPTVVSKFKPLIYDTGIFMTPGGSLAGLGRVRMTLSNELSFFTNKQLNSRMKISEADPVSASAPGADHGKQELYGLFHASSDQGGSNYYYCETIFPKSVNSYRPFKLKRPHYEEEPGLNSNGYDRALNRSFWKEMQRGRTSEEVLELPPIFSDGTSRLRTNQSASNSQNWPQHTQIPHLMGAGTANIANGLTSSVMYGSGSGETGRHRYGPWNHITHYVSPGIVTNGVNTLTGTLDGYGNLNVQPYGGFVQHVLYQPYPISLLSMWPLDVREDVFDVFVDSEGDEVVPPYLTSSIGGKGRQIGVSPHSVGYLPPSTVHQGAIITGSVRPFGNSWLTYYIHNTPALGGAGGMVTRSAGELAYSTKPTIFYYRRSQTNHTASAQFTLSTTIKANSSIILTSSHGRAVIYTEGGTTNVHSNPVVVGFSRGSNQSESAYNLVNAINAVNPASASAHSGSSAKFGPYHPGITASYDVTAADRPTIFLGQTSHGFAGQTKIATAGDFNDSVAGVGVPHEFTGGKDSESGYASPTASLQYLRHTYPYNTPFYVTNKVIGRDPMYNDYNSFIGDIVKYLGRDYSIVPEFRISPNYKYYHNYVGGKDSLEKDIYQVTDVHPKANILFSKPIIRRKNVSKQPHAAELLSKINNLSIEGGEISSSAGIESLSLLESPSAHPDTGLPQRWRYDNNFGVVESSADVADPHHWDWDSGSVAFREKYLHTDDIVNFSHLLDQKGHGFENDINTVPNEIRFVCRAVKKLLPYNGFYPVLRTTQLGTYLSSAFGPFISSPHMTTNQLSFTQPNTQKGHDDNWGLDLTGDPDARTTGTPLGQSGKLKKEQTQLGYSAGFDAARLQSLLEPMMAPGILYNSIKSGIAVEYPVYNKVPRLFVPPSMVTGSQMSASFGYGGGYMLGESRTTPAILKSAPDYNLPFEALYDPAQVRFGVSKYKPTYLVPDFTDFDRISSSSFDDTQDGTPGHSANYTYSPNCLLTSETDGGWDDPSLPLEVPEYFSAMNNFLAETMQFFLADQEFNVKFPIAVSKPKPKESLVFNDDNSVFYMSVGLHMGRQQIMCEGPRRSGYKINPTSDFQKASSIRGYLYGPPIEIVPLTGSENNVVDFIKNFETGDYDSFNTVGMYDYESYYAANLQDPAYQAFTPSYFYGESQLILNLTSSDAYNVGGTDGVSMPWIKEHTKQQSFYFEKYNVTGGLAQWVPNTASVSSGSATRMKIEASIDVFNEPILIKRQGQDEKYYSWYIAPKWVCPVLDFSSSFAGIGTTRKERTKGPAGPSIKTIYETVQNTYHDDTTGRSLWGGYGTDPYDPSTKALLEQAEGTKSAAEQKGIYMTIGDTFSVIDESALPSDVGFVSGLADNDGFFTSRSTYRDTLPQTDSLLDKLGFEKRSYEIGRMAAQKSISEALVIIPYFDRAVNHAGDKLVNLKAVEGDQNYISMPELYETREVIPGKHFLPIQEDVFERILSTILSRELYDKDNPIFEKLNGASNDVYQSALATDCGKMIKTLLGSPKSGQNGYQIPPEFDFIHDGGVRPFQMMVIPFQHTLKKQDLINIYQGIMPEISMTAEKAIKDIIVNPSSIEFHDALLPEAIVPLPNATGFTGFGGVAEGDDTIVDFPITVDMRTWAPASFLSPLPFITALPPSYSGDLLEVNPDGGPAWPSWSAKDFYKNLKFMVFKVKERGQKDFKAYREKQIARQVRQELKKDPNAPELSFELEDKFSNIKLNEVVGHNWPYDYFSLIETIKVDIEFKVGN